MLEGLGLLAQIEFLHMKVLSKPRKGVFSE